MEVVKEKVKAKTETLTLFLLCIVQLLCPFWQTYNNSTGVELMGLLCFWLVVVLYVELGFSKQWLTEISFLSILIPANWSALLTDC
jgi:hypothetical protein